MRVTLNGPLEGQGQVQGLSAWTLTLGGAGGGS